MKTVILTSYTAPNVYLVNYLTDRKNVAAKVIEQKPLLATRSAKWDKRKRMLRKYGFVKTMNKLLFNKYGNYLLNKNNERTISDLLFAGKDFDYKKDIPTVNVENINEKKCKDFIMEHNPDVIAVCGTTVIKPEIFQLAPKGAINIHVGIIPEYRSADPIFWALYNNEPDKVGVTIHYVDAGIDTGSIIYQEPVGVTKNDNLATLYCKCIKKGAALMSRALDDIEKGVVKPIRKENVKGKAYFHMDLGIWQYFQFQRRFRKLRRSLQENPYDDKTA